MTRSACRTTAAVLLAVGTAFGAPRPAAAQGSGSAAAAYPGRYPYTEADINFVTGMIGHHAQAIVMAGWAPTHGANKSVSILCERIINAQQDEITLMQSWLRDRKQPVPEAKAGPMKMKMNGTEMEMMMPGMLTDDQMKQLDKARGPEFDRLFLTFMIQHHQGAITMVNELFASPGAGQDEFMYKFASDVFADQGTEIERMQKMLTSLPGK
ncbi:MAG TPA: DUF305 domain-containing protein [Gemmatimonadaceae bacterium]|nr:DUF305 domain-containing protein [Gemmatimonadaceae bacterium]